MVRTTGPTLPGAGNGTLATAANPNAVSFMEWSNSLARVISRQGEWVACEFTKEKPCLNEVLADVETITVNLRVRQFFEGESAAIAMDAVKPGELTQGLCSPWQNDYRECSCYYWARRPDYVNVGRPPERPQQGDNWLQKRRRRLRARRLCRCAPVHLRRPVPRLGTGVALPGGRAATVPDERGDARTATTTPDLHRGLAAARAARPICSRSAGPRAAICSSPAAGRQTSTS